MATTRAQRSDAGRALRMECPRSRQAAWKPHRDADAALALIEESNAGRIPGLIPVRYGRMAQSPFAFFRGCAIVQARDLLDTPSTGVTVQLCGDCHIMNFGGFATPERNLIFDINDFDETYPGPWEWDVKRLAVSLVLAARVRGFSQETARDAVRDAAASYREKMFSFAELSPLEIWYTQIGFADLGNFFRRNADAVGSLQSAERFARGRTSEAVFPKLTAIEDGRATILNDPPLVYHFHKYLDQWEAMIAAFFERYRRSLPVDRQRLFERYAFQDIAAKVVGIGSVGTRCAMALFLADEIDPLFLQIKEARRSVVEPPGADGRFHHQGERVVVGQRLMQAASDIFLGWAEVPGSQDYYVRQLRDMKVSVDIETFRARALLDYGVVCGWALARAHAKAGDAATISGYLGRADRFDRALVRYACAYADQVERDFAAFQGGVRSGRFPTEIGEFTDVDFLP
ncbi:MAG: DUF2252 domain-containing protein [Candidatus Eremiobacteraeota bacterium]|nr:DUF2252 domain-containing protein [Candidatus Eremiobacteraeota bacterium]